MVTVNDKAYLFGGISTTYGINKSVYTFDPEQATWEEVCTDFMKIYEHNAFTTIDGKVYLNVKTRKHIQKIKPIKLLMLMVKNT